jgi:hypothetical protein
VGREEQLRIVPVTVGDMDEIVTATVKENGLPL